MPLRRPTKKQQKAASAGADRSREPRGVSGFVSKLRHIAQEREAEFTEAHPSPDVQVTAPFATRSGTAGAGVVGEEGKEKGFLRRVSSQWWDRLLGAASDRSFSGQSEQYAAHQTKRDYIFNTVGHSIWGFVFPLLTIVVTQLADVEKAGMFSFAFVVGTLMMIAAQYGVRTYQVSDLDEEHSFSDYQINRIATVLLVLIVGFLFVRARGYEGPMVQILMGVFAYRLIDALADCYEGRLQQMDKMYLAGISQMLRAIAGIVAFTVVLLVGQSVGAASIGMAIGAAATFVFITFPLALLETPKSRKTSFRSIGSLFRQCFPIFVALFLYAVVDNTPKFVMEVTLPYENQLYFNALYFPAQSILLTVGLVYKPQLVRMATAWADRDNRHKFDIFIVVMLLGVVLITVAVVLFMKYAGVWLLGILYGVDFEKFRTLSYLMIIAGGMTGGIDFLYQVITIMRRQELVTRSYLIAFAIGVVSSILLIHFGELEGAVTAYVLTMSVLFAMLLWVYVVERVSIARHPERDMALLLPAPGTADGVNAALSGYGTHVAENTDEEEIKNNARRSMDVLSQRRAARKHKGFTAADQAGQARAAAEMDRAPRDEGGDSRAAGSTVRMKPPVSQASSTAVGAAAQQGRTDDGPVALSASPDGAKPAARKLSRRKLGETVAARSAIIAEEISALDDILPSVSDAGDAEDADADGGKDE